MLLSHLAVIEYNSPFHGISVGALYASVLDHLLLHLYKYRFFSSNSTFIHTNADDRTLYLDFQSKPAKNSHLQRMIFEISLLPAT